MLRAGVGGGWGAGQAPRVQAVDSFSLAGMGFLTRDSPLRNSFPRGNSNCPPQPEPHLCFVALASVFPVALDELSSDKVLQHQVQSA